MSRTVESQWATGPACYLGQPHEIEGCEGHLDANEEIVSRLSRIDTLWSVVCEAHDQSSDQQPAQELLLNRYGVAIKRYLIASLRDLDLAEEVFQDFALKFVRGDLKAVSPQKGKFRTYVKTVLANLIRNHQRKRAVTDRLGGMGSERDVAMELAADDQVDDQEDRLLSAKWREDLLDRTWSALASDGAENSNHYCKILRYRVEHPAESYDQLCVAFTEISGRDIKPGNARILVYRAREKFAQLLIQLVADSLPAGSFDEVESELVELGLLDYCRETLQELKSKG